MNQSLKNQKRKTNQGKKSKFMNFLTQKMNAIFLWKQLSMKLVKNLKDGMEKKKIKHSGILSY